MPSRITAVIVTLIAIGLPVALGWHDDLYVVALALAVAMLVPFAVIFVLIWSANRISSNSDRVPIGIVYPACFCIGIMFSIFPTKFALDYRGNEARNYCSMIVDRIEHYHAGSGQYPEDADSLLDLLPEGAVPPKNVPKDCNYQRVLDSDNTFAMHYDRPAIGLSGWDHCYGAAEEWQEERDW
jgi:hypothetical protein